MVKKIAMLLILCATVEAQRVDCNMYPFASARAATVEPGGDQSFWSLIQPCNGQPFKVGFEAKLLRDGQFVSFVFVGRLRLIKDTPTLLIMRFTAPVAPGLYQLQGTVSDLKGNVLAVNDAWFRVEAL